MEAEQELNRQSEVIYQIYPRSFNISKDAPENAPHGDLKGITEKLDYIKSLGVDAIWISPFFKTPNGIKGDNGYAVSDYEAIDQNFGTMNDFKELVKQAHAKRLRVYTDFVMCHTSDEHEWFEKSRNREAGFENYYVWADGEIDAQGNHIPPNNWKSVFGDQTGSAWKFDEKRKQFYLHHFADSQPALNGNDPQVRKAILKEMEFWLDQGVDGLRLDALPFANYDPSLWNNENKWKHSDPERHDDFWNEHNNCQHSTIDYIAEIRAMFDKYNKEHPSEHGKKITLGEAIAGRKGGYDAMEVAKDYVHQTKGLDTCYVERLHWQYPSADVLRYNFSKSLAYFPDGGRCNFLSNHDFSRINPSLLPNNCPRELQTKAIKQLMALNFSLPGSVCMYQGDELGLPDARLDQDIPKDKIQDHVDNGRRDPARTPIFGIDGRHNPYLPVPDSHKPLAVSIQEQQYNSMLNYTKRLIDARQNNPALQAGEMKILKTKNDIFAFTRQAGDQVILCVANMSIKTNKFKPSDYIKDPAILEKLGISSDTEMTLGAFEFSRRGLRVEEKSTTLSNGQLKNGHTGTKIFAADLLLADIFHHPQDGDCPISGIIKEQNWIPAHRESISKELNDRLLGATHDEQKTTIGGSTLLTLSTLKQLNNNISVDFMGVTGSDKFGNLIKKYLQDYGIEHLTPNWPASIPEYSAVSHIMKTTGSHDIVVTHAGTEAEALQETLKNDPKLLETSIAKSDIVYLAGSLIEKFGKPFIDDILRLRWEHGKEMVLALPVHASYGHDDCATFRDLFKSSNIIVGNDSEFCRIYELGNPRLTSEKDMQKDMKTIVENVQKAFSEHVLQNNLMPCKNGQVALITRGDKPAILITETDYKEIPIVNTDEVAHLTGAGDASIAAFLDAELRGLSHEQAARFAMAMGAEKVRQKDESPHLLDPIKARNNVFLRKDPTSYAQAYNSINNVQQSISL